ncbi:MAG: TIGR00341 family protein [Acidobacteriota bacterium]|nr:MAG: TIGR00341 family protein [Acidobacteriota bacterium]
MEQQNLQRFRFLIKIARFWRRFRDKFAAALDVSTDRKVELYVELSKSAGLRDVVYWLQIIFSAGIATLGLILNSSAVIIGAMLISPLMGPILSAGLSLASGDLILAIRSSTNLILSTLAAILFAVILVAFLPFKDITPEIDARTAPNLLDLVIALFSGAIGSVATCRQVRGVVTSIPGVAIAVALMPPLCVIGFGVGVAISFDPDKGLPIAGGGALLFLTNLVAITFTAMLVFLGLRVDTAKVREKVDLWKSTDRENLFWRKLFSNFPSFEKAREIRSFSLRLLMILLPLLLISIPLSRSYAIFQEQIATKQAQNRIVSAAREIWKPYAVDSEGNIRSYLDELRVEFKGDKATIVMRVFDNVGYTQAERNEFVRRVADKLGRAPDSLSLQLIEIPTSAREQFSPVIETTPTPLTVLQTQNLFLQEIGSAIEQMELPQPAQMIDYSINIRPDRITNFQINYLSPRDIENDGKALLLTEMRRRLSIPNLSLSFNRISSEVEEITFRRNGPELEQESQDLLRSAAASLQAHPALRLRVMIRAVDSNEELTNERMEAVKRILVEEYKVSEERLATGIVEGDDLPDTFQIFLRR